MSSRELPTLVDPDSRTSRSAAAVSAAFLASAAISVGQAVVLTAIVGEGEKTDAFLAAYSVFLSVALLASTMRAQLVPLLGATEPAHEFRRRAEETAARASLVGVVLAAGLLLVSPLASSYVTSGLSTESRRTALEVLIVLAPASALQFRGASLAAILAAAHRFTASAALYVASGCIALSVSASLLAVVGPIGSALGVLSGSVAFALGHELYVRRFGVRLRMRAPWLVQRGQWAMAVALVGFAAMGQVQQINLAIAVSEVSSGNEGSITVYTYAFFLVGLVLTVTSVALGLAMLPRLVARIRTEGEPAVAGHVVRLCGLTFLFVSPLLTGLVLYGRPLLELVLAPILSRESIDHLDHLSQIFTAYAVPTAVMQALVYAVLALRRWQITLGCAAVWLILQALAVEAIGNGDPDRVAVAHALAAFLAMTVMLVVVLRGASLRVVRSVAALLLATGLVALAAMSPGLLVGAQESAAGATSMLIGGGLVYVLVFRALRPWFMGLLDGRLQQRRQLA
jgi:peptidoglycan biosynthesis protein MviN/MurJ (putative lipid II flippase)